MWPVNYLYNVLNVTELNSPPPSQSNWRDYFYNHAEFLFVLDLWYPWEHLWEQQQNRPCSLLSCLQGDLSVCQMPPEAAGKELLQAVCKSSSARYSKHSCSGWNLQWITVSQKGNPQLVSFRKKYYWGSSGEYGKISKCKYEMMGPISQNLKCTGFFADFRCLPYICWNSDSGFGGRWHGCGHRRVLQVPQW